MKCIEVEKNLDAFLDGEFAQSNEIETHLKNCASCRTAFENLDIIRRNLKQHFSVSAPLLIGEKVLSAFQNYHDDKRREKVETKPQTEKIGWFGIPRFAFASALILFALATISSFQIGRMSAGEIVILMPQVQENKTSTTTDTAKNNLTNDEKPFQIKYVKVPIIQEKIVEVPLIKEKIITKKVYVRQKNPFENMDKSKSNTALTENKANNEYLTPIELKGFQPVAKIKAQITKKSEVNENYE